MKSFYPGASCTGIFFADFVLVQDLDDYTDFIFLTLRVGISNVYLLWTPQCLKNLKK